MEHIERQFRQYIYSIFSFLAKKQKQPWHGTNFKTRWAKHLQNFHEKEKNFDMEHIKENLDNTFSEFSSKRNDFDMENIERQSRQYTYNIFWQKKWPWRGTYWKTI